MYQLERLKNTYNYDECVVSTELFIHDVDNVEDVFCKQFAQDKSKHTKKYGKLIFRVMAEIATIMLTQTNSKGIAFNRIASSTCTTLIFTDRTAHYLHFL